MEKATKDWKLTRRGWIVLVILPALLAALLFGYVTRDVCWVGLDQKNFMGYGSCSLMIDNMLKQEGKNK